VIFIQFGLQRDACAKTQILILTLQVGLTCQFENKNASDFSAESHYSTTSTVNIAIGYLEIKTIVHQNTQTL
jgi:hypothetical protein